MNTLSAVKLACKFIGYDARPYSGRNMYGRECLGIDVPRGTSAAKVAFQLAMALVIRDQNGRDAAEALAFAEWRQDSMGLGSIVYIPSLVWEDEESGKEEEDEDEDEGQLEGEDPHAVARFAAHQLLPRG